MTPGTNTRVRPADGMVMVYVPDGSFTMGLTYSQAMAECNKLESDCTQVVVLEQPPHTVPLGAYWFDQTDVTNAMYAKCVHAGATGCKLPASPSSNTHSSYYGNPVYDNYPVIYVTWQDAHDYCAWAGARLPSEAEWEKAARGTGGWTFPWGNDAPNSTQANSNTDDTTSVDSHPAGASPYGALDMAGNVWNWLSDWFKAYPGGDQNATKYYGTVWHVLRGGSFASLTPFDLRSTRRAGDYPVNANQYDGFRCALSGN